jgi:glyoxalase family protein
MQPVRPGPGAAHHLALTVDSTEELEAWRDYLRSRSVQTTEIIDRGRFSSLYLRDPDGHILELATRV